MRPLQTLENVRTKLDIYVLIRIVKKCATRNMRCDITPRNPSLQSKSTISLYLNKKDQGHING
jgi:hypothetical protein